jgi:hypothetical protein
MCRSQTKKRGPPMRIRVAVALLCGLLLMGCAGTQVESKRGSSRVDYLASAREVGRGPRFRPGPTGALAARAARADSMRCRRTSPAASVAHIEVFAANHVVVIPAGIGFAPPLVRRGAYVQAGRCAYPLRTLEPTGLVLAEAGPTRSIGQFFDLWGQPLGRGEVAGFHASNGHGVSVFVNGARWPDSPRSAPISPHSQITIEVGPYVRPHASYSFPPIQAIGRGSRPAGRPSPPLP